MDDVDMDLHVESGGREAPEAPGGASPPRLNHPRLQSPQGPAEAALNAWGMLARARQLVEEGKPSLALQAVVMAVKTEGGENAVVQTLHRARELYRNKLQTNVTADELASLFAKCAIAEAQPSGAESLSFHTASTSSIMLPNMDEASILAESGRKQIVFDAFLDGSSFVCLQCGGLVSNLRKEEHLAYWCCGQM